MKISKITKKQAIDIAVRTLKTFIVAGIMSISTLGFPTKENWQAMTITFLTAGGTAVWNLIIKAFTNEESEV